MIEYLNIDTMLVNIRIVNTNRYVIGPVNNRYIH